MILILTAQVNNLFWFQFLISILAHSDSSPFQFLFSKLYVSVFRVYHILYQFVFYSLSFSTHSKTHIYTLSLKHIYCRGRLLSFKKLKYESLIFLNPPLILLNSKINYWFLFFKIFKFLNRFFGMASLVLPILMS